MPFLFGSFSSINLDNIDHDHDENSNNSKRSHIDQQMLCLFGLVPLSGVSDLDHVHGTNL